MAGGVCAAAGKRLAPWLFLLVAGAALPGNASAVSYALAEYSDAPLGKHARCLRETARPLDIDRARRALQAGEFERLDRAVGSFGIGGRPVWCHLAVNNPLTVAERRYLIIGKSWLDQLDIYLVRRGAPQQHWRAGDEIVEPFSVTPGVGYVLPVSFQPGNSGLFIRVKTFEPMVLSVSLLSAEQLDIKEERANYRFGLLYGFLLAFICYNTMLYFGLRDRSYLYYALYLFSYIVLSLSYTGHAQVWLWPGQVEIQRYAVMSMMVVFGSAGFLFAGRFLHLELHAPRARCWVTWGSLGFIALMALSVVLESHLATVFIAFNFLAVFTVGMVWLGCLAISHGEKSGYYFLGAAICSMVGVAITLFAVWGFLPVNSWTFHGVEFGLVLEAVLLSLALASRFRQQEEACRAAEQLSRIDTLTGLPNRRAFSADTVGIWSTAVRHNRPLSAIMLDIDHFKWVNDRHGHQAGDRVLVGIARLLSNACREEDLLARWGGEEFVLLLPETDLAQACLFSERIRRTVESYNFGLGPVSVSLGVAQWEGQFALDDLIGEADQRLYQAKRGGRNRVFPRPDRAALPAYRTAGGTMARGGIYYGA